jgi:hypothetical protein
MIPEIFVEVALYPVSNGLGLTDIDSILSCFWINASKKVDPGILRLFSGQYAVKFASWTCDCFTCPVR